MDKDSIYKTFQEICRQVPVVILGSGPSCAAGIPGMRSLAERLLDKLRNMQELAVLSISYCLIIPYYVILRKFQVLIDV